MSERIKIRNPFDAEQNGCFGCGPLNPAGLKLSFEEDERKLYAVWEPSMHFQGYINVLHGGIAATLLDEAGAWCIYVKCNTAGVTSAMTVRYLKPVYINKGTITVEAEVMNVTDHNARLSCTLLDGEGKRCVEADIDYFIYPEKIARGRFYYPGREAFYFNQVKTED